MSYLGLGVAFMLGSFLVASVVLTAAVVLAWPVLRGHLGQPSSFLALRLLPSVGSVALVLGVLASFLIYEPWDTQETIGWKLLPVAVLALIPIAVGLGHGISAWLAGRRLVQGWIRGGTRLELDGAPIPIYRIPAELPLATVVGVLRPRLFVSARLLAALDADELRAMIEHEAAHVEARDNFRRALMTLAPDWLRFLPAAREIEASWIAHAEEAADERAAGPRRSRGLHVASSLLKAARLTPAGAPAPAAGLGFAAPGTVSRRVARLLEAPSPAAAAPTTPRRLGLALGASALLAATVALGAGGLRAIYELTEAAVRLLQ